MRIALVGPAAPREFAGLLHTKGESIPVGLGGTPVNALVRALLGAGHHITLITASPDIEEVWRVTGDGLDMAVVPYRRRARERARDLFRMERRLIADEIRRIDVQIINAHWSYEFGWPAVTSQLPHVLTTHDAPLTILRHLPDPYRLLRALMAYRVRYAARTVIAVSPYLAKAWHRQMGYRRPIAVIPNIVPDLPVRQPQQHDHPVVLDISDSSRRKNVLGLLRAFRLVHARFPEAELRLVGPGLGVADVLALRARKEGLTAGVTFLGPLTRPEVAQELADATVLCHSSFEESQGMIFLEAMRAEVPIIGGHDAGGAPWTLGEGAAGLLVDVHDPARIAAGVARVVEDSDLRNQLVTAGRHLAATRYSPASVADAYTQIFSDVLDSVATCTGVPHDAH